MQISKKKLLCCEYSSCSSSGPSELMRKGGSPSSRNQARTQRGASKLGANDASFLLTHLPINTVSWPRHRIEKDARFLSVYTKPI